MGRLRVGKRLGQWVRVGASDPSLTGVSGMAAITELCEQLDVVGALDTAVSPIKQRARGHSAGGLLVGLAAAQLAGEDHLVGLDRQREDAAGQALMPVAGLCSTAAGGLARRLIGRSGRYLSADERDGIFDLRIERFSDHFEELWHRTNNGRVQCGGEIVDSHPKLKGCIHGGDLRQTPRIVHLEVMLPGEGSRAITVQGDDGQR